MASTKSFTSNSIWVVAILLGCSSSVATLAYAQQNAQGKNALCTTAPNCSPTVATTAFIDASVFLNPGVQGKDLCDTIFGILTSAFGNTYPTTGAVVDARGISGSALTCTLGSPWTESTSVIVPSTLLLPAGTILIPSAWVLPPNTHVIGQGDNIGSGTTLQACNQPVNGCFTDTAMIQFGLSSLCTTACTGIPLENLNLDGQGQMINGQAINGIVNGFSQDLSYVDHVSLYQIIGTGLSVTGNANNSGPYSNITFDTGAYATFLSVAERQSASPPNRASTSGAEWQAPAIRQTFRGALAN
jgi:hypothetical protein